MNYTNILLILLSVVFSSSRNIISKGISKFRFGTKKFFLLQFFLFLGGSITIHLIENTSFVAVAPVTLFYALIYGMLLICAQWCYTAALSSGKIAVCSTLYSLGFIFPTISGVLFWNEKMSVLNVLGIIFVIPAVIISGMKTQVEKKEVSNNKYIIPIIIAMLSAGGLGIMQKIQQSSPYAEQKPEFVLIGFIFASLTSLVCFAFAKLNDEKEFDKNLFVSAIAGVCFGVCNLLNTTLAGRLDSAVFFPLYNISVILFSIILSFIIFKEKMAKKEVIVFIFGVISILLLNL